MSSCRSIDPLVTPYIDGQLATADRLTLETHLRACPPCRSRVDHERIAHDLVAARKAALTSDAAPPALRSRCAAACHGLSGSTRAGTSWRARLTPYALAASLVVIVAAAFAYPLTANSSRIMAAELAVDHMKCSLLNSMLGTRDTPALVEQSLAADFGWPADLPDEPGQAGLELVGERTCLYGQGRIAHMMYRHQGQTVSVFMLPDAVRERAMLDVLGHRAVVWSVGGRTFVLIAREPVDEVERMASFVQASLR
jgi:anti-sigma factor RsiW